MKRHRFTAYPLFALLGLILSPLAVVHASPSPADSVHFCAFDDHKQWRRGHPHPAAKRLADLNAGEPRTVRMVYLLPNDRPYRQEVVDEMKTVIRQVQAFYAEQMQAHGYGNTTFRFETDAQGEPVVHHVDGQHPDRYYLNNDTIDAILDDFQFDIDANVYLVIVDNSEDVVISGGDYVGGVAMGGSNKAGGIAVAPSSLPFSTVAHELGHTFGLGHDFRDDAYIMSYGYNKDRLSACAAQSLSVHPYFNFNSSLEKHGRPTIKLISPLLYPAGSVNVPIQLKVSDSKGIHQVLLGGWSEREEFFGLKECRGLAGEKDVLVEFEYDVTAPSSSSYGHHIYVYAINTDGNESYYDFNLVEISPYHIATLTGHEGQVFSVSFSPDGTLLAAGGGGAITLWDVASRRTIANLTEERRSSDPVSFSPDGTLLAAGSWSGMITLWDVASRRTIATLEGHTEEITSVSFSPDGTLLAAGSRYHGKKVDTDIKMDTDIKLWDVASRRTIATLEGHTGGVHSVSFSPDGTLLAAGSGDTAGDTDIKLWDVASRRKIATLEGHTSWVLSVSFSPDGTLLASGGSHALASDSTVRLWDVASRREIATLTGRHHWVWSVSFSPDGTLLAAGLDDHTITLWDMSGVAAAQAVHSLTKVSGNGQKGPANTRLAKPFVVSALNQDGSPASGVRVAFSVTAGGGLLSPTTDADPCAVGSSASSIASYTNANGQASVRLTLSSQVKHSVKATVEGLEPVTFIATKSGQAMPHRLRKVCGDSQEGIVDEQLDESFVVSVSDEHGAAIAGVAVSFAVTAGGGTLSSATATTNANGRAATRLTLGNEPGANTVSATVAGLESVTFTATGEKSDLAGLFDALGAGKQTALPNRTQLLQNAPNPFNSQTVLSYFLLEPDLTRLEVFSLTGQRVAVLHQGPQQAGYHRLHWDGGDDAGRPVASGMYLYRLVTAEDVLTRKLVLLR